MKPSLRILPLSTLALVLAACGGTEDMPVDPGMSTPDAGTMGPPDMGMIEPECRVNADCGGATPFCEPEAGACAAPPRAGALGWGDGTPGSVTFEEVHVSMRAAQATDLEFSNERPNELWVLHREVPNELPCTRDDTRGCFDLQGSTTTIFDPGTPSQRTEWIRDFNAWHFMRRPPAIAFGVDGFFATCGEEITGNYLDGSGSQFIGPSLWTSDPSIYRNWTLDSAPMGWNGTHMDMLHESPFCTGIAHDQGNAYWVSNGLLGTLEWYDFRDDHGPGQADHSDGLVRRHTVGITRVPFVPGHLVVHDGSVFVADAGAARVIAYDPSTATLAGEFIPNERDRFGRPAISEHTVWNGGTVTEIIPAGTLLQQPSGLEIHDGILYVSDHATGVFHAFELDGTPIRTLDSGLGAGHLAGMAFSPEGQLYFVDLPRSAVLRVVPD